ncbi:MAG: T9SS type A sorting domain-containing protein [Flavobacteriaceae bacterium]
MKLNKFNILRNYLLLASWFLLLGSFPAYAQDWQWIKDGGSLDGNPDEQVIDMVTDSDRNVYVISQVGKNGLTIDGNVKTNWGDNTTLRDIALASFSCDGTYRWSKIIGGGGVDVVKSVQVDSQDNVYVVGRFAGHQDTQTPPRIDNDYIMAQSPPDARVLFIAKFDKDGVFQWIKRPQAVVTPSTDTPNALPLEMVIDNDIIYWFVSLETGTYANGAFTTGTYTGYRKFVFKYDTSGNFISAITLDFHTSYSSIKKLYRNPYNGYYYLMHSKTGGGIITVNGIVRDSASLIACFDSNGTFLWIRESNTTNTWDVVLHGLAFDPSNNIYVAGKMIGFSMGINFLGFNIPDDLYPAFVLKVNPTADTLLWSSYGSTTAENIGGVLYNNGEVAYTGSATGQNFNFSSSSSLTLNVNTIGQHKEVLFAQFDAQTGSVTKLSKITGDSGNLDYGTAIAVDTNGDYLVGGGFGHYIYDMNGNQNINAGGSSDFFVAKFATGACNALSVDGIEMGSIQLYPNPAKNSISISAKEPISTIAVYTVLGQEVLSKNANLQQAETVNVSHLTKGTYFIKVQVGNAVKSYTFVKE